MSSKNLNTKNGRFIFTGEGLQEFRRILRRSRGKKYYKEFYHLTGVSIGRLHEYENSDNLKEIWLSSLEKLAPHMVFDGEQPSSSEEALEWLIAIVTQVPRSPQPPQPPPAAHTFEEFLSVLKNLEEEEAAKVMDWVTTKISTFEELSPVLENLEEKEVVKIRNWAIAKISTRHKQQSARFSGDTHAH